MDCDLINRDTFDLSFSRAREILASFVKVLVSDILTASLISGIFSMASSNSPITATGSFEAGKNTFFQPGEEPVQFTRIAGWSLAVIFHPIKK